MLGCRSFILDTAARRDPIDRSCEYGRLHAALFEATETLRLSNQLLRRHFSFKSFTDNIVLVWECTDDGEADFGSILQEISKFQLIMANHGFFVRGGLAFGEAFIDDYAVVGAPLIEAVRAEEDLAVWPRIVLCESARQLADCYGQFYADNLPLDELLFVDHDGELCLDYLAVAIVADLDAVEDVTVRLRLVEQHAWALSWRWQRFGTFRRKRDLTAFQRDDRLTPKYRWLIDYHNRACEKLAGAERYRVRVDPGRWNTTSLGDGIPVVELEDLWSREEADRHLFDRFDQVEVGLDSHFEPVGYIVYDNCGPLPRWDAIHQRWIVAVPSIKELDGSASC